MNEGTEYFVIGKTSVPLISNLKLLFKITRNNKFPVPGLLLGWDCKVFLKIIIEELMYQRDYQFYI